MDKGNYKFNALENKYGGFIAPSYQITIGSKKLDSAKIPVSALTVEIESGDKAGGCQFTLQAQYDYGKSSWDNGVLSSVSVGEKLSVKLGYVKLEEVFYGFVDDFTVEYSSDAAPCLSVTGIDAKGYLMNATDRRFMSDKKTAAVVKEILGECVSKGYAKKVTVGGIVDFDAQLIQEEIDDFKFLCFIAQMYNMSFFVVDGEIVFDQLMNDTKPIITLAFGTSLLSFSKSLSLRKQIGKVVVYGIDPLKLEPISGQASSTSVSATGKDAGDTARAFDGMVEKENNYFVRTADECKKLAQARYDARAFSFMSGRGRCVGLPELIPGRYIELTGLDSKTNDVYFISKVTHEYSQQGYFTTFEVKGAKSK